MCQFVYYHLHRSLMSVLGLKNTLSVKTLSLKGCIPMNQKIDCMFAGVTVLHILSLLYQNCNTCMIHDCRNVHTLCGQETITSGCPADLYEKVA